MFQRPRRSSTAPSLAPSESSTTSSIILTNSAPRPQPRKNSMNSYIPSRKQSAKPRQTIGRPALAQSANGPPVRDEVTVLVLQDPSEWHGNAGYADTIHAQGSGPVVFRKLPYDVWRKHYAKDAKGIFRGTGMPADDCLLLPVDQAKYRSVGGEDGGEEERAQDENVEGGVSADVVGGENETSRSESGPVEQQGDTETEVEGETGKEIRNMSTVHEEVEGDALEQQQRRTEESDKQGSVQDQWQDDGGNRASVVEAGPKMVLLGGSRAGPRDYGVGGSSEVTVLGRPSRQSTGGSESLVKDDGGRRLSWWKKMRQRKPSEDTIVR